MTKPIDPLGRFTSQPGEMHQVTKIWLRTADARQVLGALESWLDVFGDEPEVAAQVEAVRRAAAAIEEALQ